jgi:hypothetical protein
MEHPDRVPIKCTWCKAPCAVDYPFEALDEKYNLVKVCNDCAMKYLDYYGFLGKAYFLD